MALVNVNIIKYLIIAALISIIGIILINLYIPIFFDSKRNTVIQDKENQILFANLYQSDGWNGATIELLKDSGFRYGNFSGDKLGKFQIINDTIIFDKDYIHGKKAVLRQDTNALNKDTFLMILNKQGLLQRENRYRVHSNTNKTNISITILKKSELEPQ